MPKATKLSDVSVLVTRPEHQAETLCRLIEAQGGEAVRFPVIAIAAPADQARLQAQLERVPCSDIAIFVSANAVDWGLRQMRENHRMPDSLQIAAVGMATAKRLAHYGINTNIFPKQEYNSEALLAQPALQNVAGKRVLIVRGLGGRELLAERLRERGATLEYLECYQRVMPASDPAVLNHWLHNDQRRVITVTSNEGLENLLQLVTANDRERLLKTALIVVSERGQQLAEQTGFSQVRLAQNATDPYLLDAIIQWRQQVTQ